MNSKLDKIIEWSLYILILLLPISKSAVEVCAIIAIIGWLLKRVLGYRISVISAVKPVDTPINLPVYLFLSICFLSIFWSTYPEISIMAFTRKWLEYILVFFIVTEVIDEKKKVRNLLFSMALSALIVSADGFAQ